MNGSMVEERKTFDRSTKPGKVLVNHFLRNNVRLASSEKRRERIPHHNSLHKTDHQGSGEDEGEFVPVPYPPPLFANYHLRSPD
jgi:hypothetical protein